MTTPHSAEHDLADRIGLLAVIQMILSVSIAILISTMTILSMIISGSLRAALILCSINLVSALVLYFTRHKRYAVLMVYIHLTLLQCIVGVGDILAGDTSGATWILMQIATPIIAIVIRRKRATVIMAAITILILLVTSYIYVHQIVPVMLIVAPTALYYNLTVQIIILITLVVSTSKVTQSEQNAVEQLLFTENQLQQQLQKLQSSAHEKERLNQRLTQQINVVKHRDEQLRQQQQHEQQLQQTIQQLSAPIIPVLEGVIVIPLIGLMDSIRSETVTANILRAVEQRTIHKVILDVTGLAMIDTHVSQALLATANAVRLLGADIALVGVRPEVAQTLVALGVDIRGLRTYANLQEAMSAIALGPLKAN